MAAHAKALSGSRRWRAMAVFMVAIFLGGQDATALNTALPALTRDLAPGPAQLLWMLDGYSLAIAAFLVSCANAGDRWGRKPVFLAGLLCFAASSACAGLAAGPLMLDVARVVQGVGAAMIVSSVVASIRVIFTDARARTLAYALWTAALSVGLATGPVVGALLVQGPGWRWVFVLATAGALLALALGALWVVDSRAADPGGGGALSLVLSAAGLGGVVFALQHAGELSGAAVACGLAGLVCLAWFVRLQLRLPTPLLQLRMFASRPFTLAALAIVSSYGAYAGLLFLFSQRLQLVAGETPLHAGLTIVPFAVAVALGGLVSPPLARLLARPRATMAGLLAQAAGLAWLAAAPEGPVAALVATGLGVGIVATLAADLLMASAPEARAGEAGAIQETAFALGSGLGVAVLGTVATLALRAHLAGLGHGDGSLGATLDRARTLAPAARRQLVHAADAGFDRGFSLALLIAAALLVAVGAAVGARSARAGRRAACETPSRA